MMPSKREKSEFVVDVLNMDAFAKMVVIDLIGAGYDLNGNNRVNTHYPLGIVKAANGKHYIIDEDGCGDNDAIEDSKQVISWYKNTVDEKGNLASFGMFPFVEITFTRKEIESVPVLRKETLDEFVRVSGGDRLERLYANWTKFLKTGIEPAH